MSDQESETPAAEQSNEARAERGHRDRGRRRHRPLPRHLEASINMEELRELIGLITDNALTDFELEREGFHVKVGRNLYSNQSPVAPGLRTCRHTGGDAGPRPKRAACGSAPSGCSGRRGRFRRSGTASDNLAYRRNVLSLAFAKRRELRAHRQQR